MISNDEIEPFQNETEAETCTEQEEEPNLDSENEIDNLENLEQKKREANEFCAQNNSAQNQIFIQDMGAGGFTVNYYTEKATLDDIKLPTKEQYNLCKKSDCIKFIETFKNSEYFYTAIVLCIFKIVIVSDLPDFKFKLSQCLLKDSENKDEENATYVVKEEQYIALNSILAVINGETFETENGRQCVSLGKGSIQALENILEQFPVLQDTVAKVLIQTAGDDRYHTNFYMHQIAESMAQMIFINRLDLINQVLPSLYANDANVYLLASTVYKLYTEQKRENEADEMIKEWMQGGRTWLWRPVCLVYTLFRESGISFAYEEELKETLAKRITYFRGSDLSFLAELLMQSKYFRTMICRTFHYAYFHGESNIKKRYLAQVYVNLVRRCYYRVNESFTELALIVCDTRKQQEYLAELLEKVMSEYRLRRQLYTMLTAYLKELSRYEFQKKVIRHIAAFFCNASLEDDNYMEDIIDFLEECDNKAAKQVITLLTNEKRGEVQ